jgi:hypothetical protein
VTNFGTVDAGIDQLEEQIEKILNFAPTVPEVNAASKTLSEKTSEKETEEISEPIPEDIDSKLKTEESGETPASTASESGVSEGHENVTPISEAPAQEIEPEETPEKSDDLSDSKEEN